LHRNWKTRNIKDVLFENNQRRSLQIETENKKSFEKKRLKIFQKELDNKSSFT